MKVTCLKLLAAYTTCSNRTCPLFGMLLCRTTVGIFELQHACHKSRFIRRCSRDWKSSTSQLLHGNMFGIHLCDESSRFNLHIVICSQSCCQHTTYNMTSVSPQFISAVTSTLCNRYLHCLPVLRNLMCRIKQIDRQLLYAVTMSNVVAHCLRTSKCTGHYTVCWLNIYKHLDIQQQPPGILHNVLDTF